ncbi:unnamed protein product, partial [Scytosiphon promiscuus]
MNINVIGGSSHGLGSGGLTSGGDKGTAGGDSVPSSTPIATTAFSTSGSAAIMASSSNGGGGLPSGRSRSPGFDVDKPTSSPQTSAGDNTSVISGAAAAAAAFLSGATVVTGAPGAGNDGSGGWLGGGGGTGATGTADFSAAALGRKDGSGVDHAFAGSMLQRSTSAPPVSDHVDGWARRGVGAPQLAPDAAADNDYYYYYHAPTSLNPRMAGSSRDSSGGSSASRSLAAPIAQSHTHSILDKAPARDTVPGGGSSSVGGGSGRTSPLSTVTEQQRQINGISEESGVPAAISSRGQAAGGVTIGGGSSSNGPASSAGTVGGGAADRGSGDPASQWEPALGGGRYDRGPGDGAQKQQQQQKQQQHSQFSVTHHREGYGNGGGGGGGVDGDFVGAMGSLSLGPGGVGGGAGGSK